MLLRWILPHECPEEASLHTVPVKPCRDTPVSQRAEHCGWRSLSQHGRMIGPRCSLPRLPLITASAERSQRSQTLDRPGRVSAPRECDRVGDLSSAPLMRCKTLEASPGTNPAFQFFLPPPVLLHKRCAQLSVFTLLRGFTWDTYSIPCEV